MPTRDEDGNIIGLDDFLIALRGDDAREFILPGSIPEVSELSADPEEDDCLPPLEAVSKCNSEAYRSSSKNVSGS